MPEIDTNEFEFSVLNEALNAFIAKYGQENLPAGFIDLTKSFQSNNINIQDWNTLVVQIQQSISDTNTCKEFLVTLTDFVKSYLSDTYTKEEITTLLDYKADKANVYTKSETYNRSDADSRFVHSAGDESVSGVKTFNSVPKTLGNPSANTDLETVKHVSDNYVGLNRSENVSGVKSFVDIPETKENRVYDDERQLSDVAYVEGRLGNIGASTTVKSYSDTNREAAKTYAKNYADGLDTARKTYIDENTNNWMQKGQAGGVATLDEQGKLPLNQLSDVALGQLTKGGSVTGSGLATLTTNGKVKLGTNETQIQLLNTAEGITGYLANQEIYYILSSNGSFAGLDLKVGDWLTANADGWAKVDNTDAITGVKGDAEPEFRTGNVNITPTHIGLGNVDNTSDLNKPISTATQTALDTKINTTTANANFQSKILHVDLATIHPEDWVLDTTIIPNLYKYTSGNVYSTLGLVNTQDLAEIFGTNPLSRRAIADFDIFLDDVVTTNESTIATIYSSFLPTEDVNITVQVIKQHTNEGSVSNVLTHDDVDEETIKVIDSKLTVDTAKVAEILDVVEHFKVNGVEQTITDKTVDIIVPTNLENGTGTNSLQQKSCTASGDYSFAEGKEAIASNNNSHAEGVGSVASGDSSHAEGANTLASGELSHTEGDGTTASGYASHAEGAVTIAGYDYQHVFGKYNDNKSTTLLEIGNGSGISNRSNAFEVYADGHAEVGLMGSTNKSVATKEYADTNFVHKNSAAINSVYTVDASGAQSYLNYAENPDAYTIPKRDSTGNIKTQLTPNTDWDVASKKYVDNKKTFDGTWNTVQLSSSGYVSANLEWGKTYQFEIVASGTIYYVGVVSTLQQGLAMVSQDILVAAGMSGAIGDTSNTPQFAAINFAISTSLEVALVEMRYYLASGSRTRTNIAGTLYYRELK